MEKARGRSSSSVDEAKGWACLNPRGMSSSSMTAGCRRPRGTSSEASEDESSMGWEKGTRPAGLREGRTGTDASAEWPIRGGGRVELGTGDARGDISLDSLPASDLHSFAGRCDCRFWFWIDPAKVVSPGYGGRRSGDRVRADSRCQGTFPSDEVVDAGEAGGNQDGEAVMVL